MLRKRSKEIKGFILGMIFMAALTGTVAMANTVRKDITYGVNVRVNGDRIHFDNDTQPFIMDGRTFLPVRTVAEITGFKVDFFDNTVHLTAAGVTPPTPPTPAPTPRPTPRPTSSPAPTPTPLVNTGSIPGNGGSVNVNGATEFMFTPRTSGTWEFRTYNETGDPYLELYDASGNLLAYDDDGAGGSNALIMHYLTAGVTYRVNARFFSNVGTGSYTLSVTTFQVMASIPSGGGSVQVNGVTEFSFTPVASGIWEFRTSNNTGDPYLELYDSAGNRIAYDDDGGEGSNALIRHNLVAGVTYRIVARFYENARTGSYTLTVS